MNITIVGAGNVGTQIAVHAASVGNKVTIYTDPSKVKNELKIIDENDNIIKKGKINLSTLNPEIAFKNADVIFITYPAFKIKELSEIIYPYVSPNVKICMVPGTGGGEWYFKKCIEKGVTFFGLQRVPSVVRLVKKGETVRAVGYRDELKIATIPNSNIKSNECKKIIESIFEIKCKVLPNYLNITLTPSNPILHTTRLRTIFNDYYEGKIYNRIPLFYEEWDNESSDLLLKCDEELQDICSNIDLDLSEVRSLREHYEISNKIELTNKIKSITGFKGLETPCIKLENGVIPDFNSRYFTADFPYGLGILIQVGKLTNTNIPYMEKTMKWYTNLIQNKNNFDFKEFDIINKEDFINYYKK